MQMDVCIALYHVQSRPSANDLADIIVDYCRWIGIMIEVDVCSMVIWHSVLLEYISRVYFSLVYF